MKAIKLWEPRFFENSRLPVWLSYLSPITIGAISLGVWVFSRGEMSKTTKRHETIHFQQWLELGFLGFLLLYPSFWVIGMIRYRNGATAYRENPFEREAYDNQSKWTYLEKRKRYAWIKYVGAK